jgi:hypothetical protein
MRENQRRQFLNKIARLQFHFVGLGVELMKLFELPRHWNEWHQ